MVETKIVEVDGEAVEVRVDNGTAEAAIVELSDSMKEDLAISREQRERGETVPADVVRDRLGLDGSES